MHALHTVNASPDLRVAGGRLGDGVSHNYHIAKSQFAGLAIQYTDYSRIHPALSSSYVVRIGSKYH